MLVVDWWIIVLIVLDLVEAQGFSIFKAQFEFLSICKIYPYSPEIKIQK